MPRSTRANLDGAKRTSRQGRLLQLQKDLLHEIADRYRELFENANDIVYTTDLNGRFTSVNRAGERLTGYTQDEARKMDIAQVVAPEYLPLVRKMLARKAAGDEPATHELEIVTKDGRRVPLEVCSQLFFRNGKPVGVQGIGRNITKRRLAEDENHRRAILMGRLIGLTEALSQPVTEPGVIEAIGRGALRLSEASRAVLLVRQTDGTVRCAWSQGISSTYITQVLAHLADLPAGHLMTEVVDHVVELPGGSIVQGTRPVLISDVQAQESELLSRLAGAEGYRAAGIWPITSERRAIGVVKCYYDSPRTWSKPELDVLHVFFRQAAIALENARLYEARAQRAAELEALLDERARLDQNLQQAYVQMVLALAQATASRDSYTALHSTRLVVLAEEVARALGVGDEEIENIRWGARLHDIGKVGVPDSILTKQGPLTERERAVMQQHPIIGEEILARIERMRGVAKLVRHHQERWDGTGYPDGLRGDAIPLGARILAVVDAYGAIVGARPYKPARTHEEAVTEIRRCAGTQFDPEIVDVFCQTIERIRLPEEPEA